MPGCWLGSGVFFFSVVAAEVQLTPEEKEWRENHPKWRAVGSSSPPFQWLDKNGEYRGLAADYDRLISEKLGMEVEAIPAESWPKSLQQLKDKEIDACTLMIATPEREEFLNFSDQVLALPTVLLVRSDNNEITSIKDLAGKHVVVPQAWGVQEFMKTDHPNTHLRDAETVVEALIDVSTGRVDAYAGDMASTSHAIEKLGISNIKVAFLLPYTYSLKIGVRKDWPEFIPMLNKAIHAISEEEHEEVRRRWMAIRDDGMTFEDIVRTFGPLAGVLLLVGLAVYIGSLRREIKLRQAAEQEVLNTKNATIVALASLAETRDTDTGAHLHRTQTYVRMLAEELRRHGKHVDELTDVQIELLYNTAPLHDIGKVGIPDAILQKAGKLTEEEYAIMQTHTTLGATALEKAAEECGEGGQFLILAQEVALTHHERWDGRGYPQGLKGEAIPLSGRLMAVADVYDALRCVRCYKDAMPHDKVVEIIREESGKQFDPDVVDAFLAMEKKFREISKKFADPKPAEVLSFKS